MIREIAYLFGFSRDVRLVLLVHALVGLVSLGVNAVLLNLYLLRLGYGPQDIGLINAFGPLCYALSSLPAGALGGRWGVRRLMLAGTGIWSAGIVLMPLAETLPAVSPMGWLLVAQVLGWAGAATFFVNAVPFFIAATPIAERNHVFSATTALIPLASFAGNLIGGFLPGIWASAIGGSPDSPVVFRYALLSAALLSTIAIMAVLGTSQVRAEVASTTATEASSPLPWKRITFLSMIALLASAGGGILQAFFTLYLDASLHLPTALIGLLAGMAQLTAVPAALAMPALARRWGNENTYTLGALGMVVSMLLLALVPHWAAAATGRMGLAAFMAISGPALTVHQQAKVGPRWRAAMSGSANTAMGLSWAGMALGGGYMVAGLGYQTLFTLGAGLSAAGALLFFAYTRVHLLVERNHG